FGYSAVFSMCTESGHDTLNTSHFLDAIIVSVLGADRRSISYIAALRIAGKRDRLGGWVAVVEGVPNFFGQEGHEGRKQAQRGFKDADQRGERGLSAGGLAGLLTRGLARWPIHRKVEGE